MDKPYGPRPPPPDKRHAAYESIFGRPNPSPTGQSPVPQNYPGPHQYQAYPADRRTSYQPPPVQYPHSYQQPMRQTYYPPTQSNLSPNNTQYHAFSPSLAPPQNTGVYRARSINANADFDTQSSNEPPSSTPYPGLTAAQTYQAQVFMNAPNISPQTQAWNDPHQLSSSTSEHHHRNGESPAGPQGELPRIGLRLENDEGRLGLDFSVSNDLGTDEDSSELPWARSEPSLASSSRHQHQPSMAESSTHPLHVETAQSIRSTHALSHSPSPSAVTDNSTHSMISTAASTTIGEHPHPSIYGDHLHDTNRRSSDSARTMPRFPAKTRDRAVQDRSMSMSSAKPTIDNKRGSRIIAAEGGRMSPASTRSPAVRKTPIVYPALLSRVAQVFHQRIPITDRVKDGLTYKDAFDGREAVDKIAYIIKTTDRNLALLLGRALDAQKFFHDVTYDHRLRDSQNELYQFRTQLPSPFVSGELDTDDAAAKNNAHPFFEGAPLDVPTPTSASTPGSALSSASPLSPQNSQIDRQPKDLSSDELPLPSGVFTLLTDCYSPTCSRDQLCYSIACPRRLEQQARLNMKPQPGLSKQISKDSLNDTPDDGTLWIHSVPQEIVNSVSDQEKRRQEAINEVIYTERDFVRDMEYLRDSWVNPLKDSDIIPVERRSDFLMQVFWNMPDIIAVNTRLRDALSKRQKQYAVVDRIGDIFLEMVPHFGPFVHYGAHQLYGKYEFEKEKTSNPAFAQFVETTERRPESRKLELNAYLTKPTTRLARYPLLLEAVLKHTPTDSPDKVALARVVVLVREFLAKVNMETGKAENRFNLLQLDQQLVFRPGEEMDLCLRDENREMIYKGQLNKRDGEIHVYLFDHSILFTKEVKTKQHTQFKVYRPPIPLELLAVNSSPVEESNGTIRSQQRQKAALVRRSSFEKTRTIPSVVGAVTIKSDTKAQLWIEFIQLGRRHYKLMLQASSPMAHRKWLEVIYKQQQAMRERSVIFDTVTLSEGFFSGPNKVNCAAPYSGGTRVVYGTDDGVYLSKLRDSNQEPVKVLALLDVMQVDVLEDYQLLIVLSERQVITFPLDALDPIDPMAGLKRAKRISSHTSFFKAGFCLNKVLVCIVKSSQLSSTFKTLEPIDQNIRGRAKPTFKKLLQGGNDTLKMFREFYIPVESTSIHYLKTKMCVGCSRGFEIVDLESLDTQGLLDPNDESLDFVRKKENMLRPMAIYRVHNDFLLCYDEFAFYVNKSGRRSRKEFMVHWEGRPTGFALHEPYVLAFEPTFVEVRHIETGLMAQVIQGSNLRLLFADTPPSVTNGATPQHPYPQNQYRQPNVPYNPYAAPYPGYAQQQQQGYPDQYPRHPQGVGREEILIVSDDRVLALRPRMRGPGGHGAGMGAGGLPQQRYMSDNISMASSAGTR